MIKDTAIEGGKKPMKRLLIIISAAMMIFSIAGASLAAINVSGYAIFTHDSAAEDEAHSSEENGMDKLDYNLYFTSKNNQIEWTARCVVISDAAGWSFALREGYADIKTDFGIVRVGNWDTTTWETALFEGPDDVSFGRIKSWMGLGYTSPELGLDGLRFKVVYFPDGQKVGGEITDRAQNYNEVDLKDNAYVATLEYANSWLTVKGNLVETGVKDPKWDKSYGGTLNIISKTPLEGLQAVLYTGRDPGMYEMVIAGLWYKYRAFGFRYETDLIDDITNENADNRSAFELSYIIPGYDIELQYRYRDLQTKYNEIRAIVRFK